MPNEGPQDPLDDLIDTTARSMTEGMPPASLRTAIRERIAAPPNRLRRGYGDREGVPHAGWGGGRPLTGRLAWAGAAVAAIVLVTVGLGRDETPVAPRDDAPPVVAVTPPADPPPAVTRLSPEPAPRTRNGAPRPALVTPDRGTSQVTGDPAAEAPLVIELVEIEPLGREPLEMELMEVPMPLRAESVQIEPISIE